MKYYKHGQLNEGGNGRWCEIHNYFHGPLHSCEYYSPELLQEINSLSKNFIELWGSGTIPVVIEISHGERK